MADRTNTYPTASSFSLLRRFLQVYWLKPFDAVNDTANATALRALPWETPILEVGGGDGMFSFLMHDGEFALGDDRYAQSDPQGAGDIFDVYHRGIPLRIKKPAAPRYSMGVDLKTSHLEKARETGLYDALISSVPEMLPLPDASYQTVFLYLFHGLSDYEKTLREVRRVIRPQGKLLMVAFNDVVGRYFVCHKLQQACAARGWNRLAEYWKRLGGGRYEEISGMSKSYSQWKSLLRRVGFRLTNASTQVSPFAWKVYDVQTRPVLRPAIRWSQLLDRLHLKTTIKFLWVYSWLLPLYGFFQMTARPRSVTGESDGVLFVFLAEPVEGNHMLAP